MPLKFELGEAFHFDWSEEGLVVGGTVPYTGATTTDNFSSNEASSHSVL